MMNNNNKSNSYASPELSSSLSSPPTPSPPLPVSVGPGNKRYCFSSSPSPSPPFSPPPSTTFTSTSAENLPPPHKNIIQHYNFYLSTTDSNNKYNNQPLTAATVALPSSTFSLGHHDSLSRTSSSCLQDLWNRIEWVVGRCCCCCFGSWPPLFHNFQSNNLTIKQRLD